MDALPLVGASCLLSFVGFFIVALPLYALLASLFETVTGPLGHEEASAENAKGVDGRSRPREAHQTLFRCPPTSVVHPLLPLHNWSRKDADVSPVLGMRPIFT